MSIDDATEEDWNKVRGICAPQDTEEKLMTQDQLDDLAVSHMYVARSDGRVIERLRYGGEVWDALPQGWIIYLEDRIKPKERYFDGLAKLKYDILVDSGLFSKFYPDYTGIWEEDSE